MNGDPLFYLLAAAAVLIVGVSKGGFGGGLAMVAVPIMSLSVSPLVAAGIMLPILCVMDLVGLWAYRHAAHWPNLRIILPGAVLGIVAGALTFRFFSEHAVRLLLGLIAVGFALNYWLRPGVRGAPPRPVSLGRGLFWSGLSGFTSFVAHAGGPPINVYLLPQRLGRTVFAGTTIVFFATMNYVKLLPYGWLGQLSADNLLTSLLLAPLAPVGVLLGLWLHRRVSDDLFYRICYGLLFLVGLRLLWGGIGGLTPTA